MLDGSNILLCGTCQIDPTAKVMPGAVIGKAFRPLIGYAEEQGTAATIINAEAYVGYYTLIGAGSIVSRGAVVDDFSTVECDTYVGANTLVIYRAHICNEARIGEDCVVGGFVAEKVTIGECSRVFGQIIHSQHNPSLDWDDPAAEEGSATVEDQVFIGFNALVIGGVTLRRGAYVCAGAVVTRDVPPNYVAYNVNKMVPQSEWPGELSRSPILKRQHDNQNTRDDS